MNDQRLITARKRWQILGETLKTGKINSPSNVSVRCFQSFNLFTSKKCADDDDGTRDDGEWAVYSNVLFPSFFAFIRIIPNNHTLDILSGFNNTGNVGVWPAEEVLAHYCLQKLSMFNGKAVCELGGGMTCLAGIAIWSCVPDCTLVISDGNDRSIQNLQLIVERNSTKFEANRITVRKICWGPECETQFEDLRGAFDYILCADCLFFKETVESLSETIHFLLKPKGVAIITAPSRNGSFGHFLQIAQAKFQTTVIDEYNELVLKIHQENVKSNSVYYNPDLHYPLMMHLTKI